MPALVSHNEPAHTRQRRQEIVTVTQFSGPTQGSSSGGGGGGGELSKTAMGAVIGGVLGGAGLVALILLICFVIGRGSRMKAKKATAARAERQRRAQRRPAGDCTSSSEKHLVAGAAGGDSRASSRRTSSNSMGRASPVNEKGVAGSEVPVSALPYAPTRTSRHDRRSSSQDSRLSGGSGKSPVAGEPDAPSYFPEMATVASGGAAGCGRRLPPSTSSYSSSAPRAGAPPRTRQTPRASPPTAQALASSQSLTPERTSAPLTWTSTPFRPAKPSPLSASPPIVSPVRSSPLRSSWSAEPADGAQVASAIPQHLRAEQTDKHLSTSSSTYSSHADDAAADWTLPSPPVASFPTSPVSPQPAAYMPSSRPPRAAPVPYSTFEHDVLASYGERDSWAPHNHRP